MPWDSLITSQPHSGFRCGNVQGAAVVPTLRSGFKNAGPRDSPYRWFQKLPMGLPAIADHVHPGTQIGYRDACGCGSIRRRFLNHGEAAKMDTGKNRQQGRRVSRSTENAPPAFAEPGKRMSWHAVLVQGPTESWTCPPQRAGNGTMCPRELDAPIREECH